MILKPPHMDIEMKPGVWPDLAKMQQTIKAAGYKPIEDDVRLTASGTVRARPAPAGNTPNDGTPDLVLELDGFKEPVALPLRADKESPDTLAHLAERHVGQKVTVEGFWQPLKEGEKPNGALAVTAVLNAPAPK